MINEEQKVIRPFMERPFEYLKPSSEDILHYWYQAREYVLNYLITRIKPYKDANTFPDKWNFVVDGDNDLMLSVVRHLALYAHFLNYKECDRYGNLLCGNRTVITIISKKTTNDIREKLENHDFLGNLPKYCKTTIFGEIENGSSYIDIEIEVVRDRVRPVPEQLPVITKDLVLKYIDSIQSAETIRINTLKAICTSKAYDLGDTVNNLPYEDINSVHRYFNALNIFRKKILKFKNSDTLVKDDEWKNDSYAIKSGISNIYCAECFEIREIEIKQKAKKEKKSELETWQKYMKELSRCEHNRWVVEKLILGYEPLGKKEKFEYEHLFGEERSAYWKSLKKDSRSPKHIDICSNKDLRRIDPDNMKYDSFLMLAIPFILEYVRSKR